MPDLRDGHAKWGTVMSADTWSPVRSDSLSAWAQQLRTVAGRFAVLFPPLEKVFLATGDRLRDLHGRVAALSADAETAGALLASTEFEAMVSGLTEAANQVGSLRHRRDGLAESLAEMVATTDVMLKALTALTRVMFDVRVLAINAKIESAQLNDSGVDFSVFTREIARLALSGERTIAAVGTELSALRLAASHALSLQSTVEAEGLRELDAVAGRLTVAMAEMRERQRRAKLGVRDIPDRLRSLFAHIADLVSDLQIYDITRQRLEHVERALIVAAEMIEAPDASGLGSGQRPVFVNGIADLQARQVSFAEEGYRTAVNDVGRNLAAMAAGVPAVGAACEQSFGGDGLTLLDIEKDLETASALFAKFASSRQQAEQSLRQVAEAAGRAGELMRGLNGVNGDMRLMGLNASIKCGNMGVKGRALNVIAQQLQAYASLTRAQVEAVAANLGRVVATAGDISTRTTIGAEGTRDVVALRGALDQAVDRLRRTGAEAATVLGRIQSRGGALVESTRVVAEGFAGGAHCREPLDRCVTELKALATDSAPNLSGAALEAARQEVLAFTEAHYTMASERSIHGAVVGGRGLVDLLTGADQAQVGGLVHSEGEKTPDISDMLF